MQMNRWILFALTCVLLALISVVYDATQPVVTCSVTVDENWDESNPFDSPYATAKCEEQ